MSALLHCLRGRYLAPLLLATVAGCPAFFHNMMVDGVAQNMRQQTDEATWQGLRQKLEDAEGRPISP